MKVGYKKKGIFEFIGENVLLMELDASDLSSYIFVSIFMFSISSCSFIAVSNLVMLAMLSFSRRF